MDIGKVPPQNIDAEKAVLGSMLLDSDAIGTVIEHIREEDFYKDSHRKIFTAVLELFEKNQPVDLITLTELLKKNGHIEDIGGPVSLTEIIEAVPTSANVEYYARIVKDKSLQRGLIKVASDIMHMSYGDSSDVTEILDRSEQKIFDITQKKSSGNFVHIKNIANEVFQKAEKQSARHDYVTGLPTGFIELDQNTTGFHESELIVLAGRPSMGKTALGLNIAAHVGIKLKIPVAIFSLEMSAEQLTQRILCSEARVEFPKLRGGYLTETDWGNLMLVLAKLAEAEIFIDDSTNLTAMELRAKARRLTAQRKIGLVIIDYLQLMSHSSRSSDNRQQEISEISRSLKSLARELKVPVIAISQLSRSVEQREDKRPRLSDLRESGAIEQDADLVAFVYRESYYKQGEGEADNNKAEIIIGKQRNGPTGTINLFFNARFTKFENLAKF